MNNMADFFNALAPRWDQINLHDENKINTLLHLVQIQENATILDVGCGTGILESYLLKYNPKQVVGVDLASEMIKLAKNKHRESNITFRSMNVMDLVDEKYDYIIIYSAFPHFKEPKKLISHLKTLLNLNGKLVICHSQGRDFLNAHHKEQALEVSSLLPPAKEVAEIVEKYLDVEVLIDNEAFYMISAKNKN